MGNLTLESVLIAVSGIVIVFLMLAVLCLLIPIISRMVHFFEVRYASAKPTSMPSTSPTPSSAKPIIKNITSSGQVKLIDVDEKTAACIMAIISHETGIPLAELDFRSIRAI